MGDSFGFNLTVSTGIRYSLFYGSIVMIVLPCTPFQIFCTIIGLYLVFVVNVRIIVWVRHERFCNKTIYTEILVFAAF